ncbi:DUF1990 family protein [Microlunatus parietis]|uniref:Uncharacterized protein (UPF0548 family) n=1 Tax=Microlunatus parietis TaxID=682979 RepID=A0A7Y9I2W3_9ACTN|nr:DUF1990 domain-containing protein [Microlunatus parietis]NYE69132.1 uncharacterized protein (UPF0548 family) [Microlunatus parietis]
MTAGLSYPEVGATRGVLPPGYHHITRSAAIGRGATDFRRAAERVLNWEVQRRSGLAVSATGPVSEGADVILTIGPLRAPARVVYVIEEPRRAGFAYGTLPGHPECGEESFVVEHLVDDTVQLTVTAFSRPATLLARLGGPITRLVQRVITDRYLRVLSQS